MISKNSGNGIWNKQLVYHANRQKALDLAEQWHQAGYHVISMWDDFKTIYGFSVKKVPFSFPE